MKTIVTFDTHPHLGDNAICTAAVRNIRLSHPEFVFVHKNSEIVRNNEDFEQDAAPAKNVGKVWRMAHCLMKERGASALWWRHTQGICAN